MLNYIFFSEAWDKRPKVPTFKIPNKKIVEPTMTNKRIKTCVIQELLQSGVNNGDGNSSFRTTSILSIPMATESRIISPNGEIDEQEIKKGIFHLIFFIYLYTILSDSFIKQHSLFQKV